MATKKSTSTSLTLWEKKMADSVTKQAASEKSSTFKSISIQGGVLSVDDSPVDNNELLAVVLASAHENCYYNVAYDANKPAIPVCFAFSEVDGPEENMAPHEDSTDKQSENCASCDFNVMGSAEVGKGKACRNIRRLAVMTADGLESVEALEEAEVRMLKVPVMSTKGWATYVKEKLAGEIQRPTWGVVTKIKVVPDRKAQFKVTFAFDEMVNFDAALFEAMEKKIKNASDSLIAPYVPMPEEEEPAPRGRAKSAATKQVKPTGRMAEAMSKSAAKQGAANKSAPAKKAKY
jgi:hypothetical protein